MFAVAINTDSGAIMEEDQWSVVRISAASKEKLRILAERDRRSLAGMNDLIIDREWVKTFGNRTPADVEQGQDLPVAK
jgi:hypothetical protein